MTAPTRPVTANIRSEPSPETLDLIWGAAAIAKTIGKTRRATFHLLEREHIPARKVGNQWVASRKALIEYFEVAA